MVTYNILSSYIIVDNRALQNFNEKFALSQSNYMIIGAYISYSNLLLVTRFIETGPRSTGLFLFSSYSSCFKFVPEYILKSSQDYNVF